MRRVALTLFAFAALLAAPGSASACSCDPTATGILASYTAVFTAAVADTKEIRKYVSVTTFRITESFKGPAAGATVKVRHLSGPSASCGVKFVAGQTYTLAAHRTESKNDGVTLTTTQCSTWMFLPLSASVKD